MAKPTLSETLKDVTDQIDIKIAMEMPTGKLRKELMKYIEILYGISEKIKN